MLTNQINRFLAALGHQRMVTVRSHDLAQGLPSGGIVVSDEDREDLT